MQYSKPKSLSQYIIIKNGLFGFPDVGRFGLAHSLLAWARCQIWCSNNNAQLIAPAWNCLRIGPWVRGERDKRQYHKLFHNTNYVVGIRRLLLLATMPRRNAETLQPQADVCDYSGIVVFKNKFASNDKSFFHEIIPHYKFIRESLIGMTRSELVPTCDVEPHIAIHIRMGDFRIVDNPELLYSGLSNVRIPMEWYRNVLIGLRARIGQNLRAVVYSDGTDESLSSILSLDKTTRAISQSAITDMLAIGNASVLISSGSGFSRWGCYLTQIPRICFVGQRFCRVLMRTDIELEPECRDAYEIPQETIDWIRCGTANPRYIAN
jgi:hypothetical protein